jgi:EmrB/QacA subfamily drug resistance transporter
MSGPPTPQADAGLPVFTRRQFWTVYWGALIVLVLGVLDQNIVATASFVIVKDLDPVHGLGAIPWLIAVYLVTSTAAMPLYGKLCDLYGPKRVYLFAIGLFLAGSVACGASVNMPMLLVARAFQGLGAGGLVSVSMVIAAFMAPARERAKRLGVFGGAIAISSAVGPLIGGSIVDAFSWRWIFFVNVPLGVAAFIMVAVGLPMPTWRRKEHSLDLLGSALLIGGASSALLVAQWGGQQYAWDSIVVIGTAVASVVLFGLFIWRQATAAEPLIPLSLFRGPVFKFGSIILFISGMAMTGAILYLALFFQVADGLSAAEAGIHLLSMTIGMAISSTLTGRLISRAGRYKYFPLSGAALSATGMLLLVRVGPTLPTWQTQLTLFVLGLGLSQMLQPLVLAIQHSTPKESMGKATASATFLRSLGAAFGAGVLGAVVVDRMDAALPSRLARIVGRQISLQKLRLLTPAERHQAVNAFVSGTHAAFVVGASVMIIAFLIGLTLPNLQMESAAKKSVPTRTRGAKAALPD